MKTALKIPPWAVLLVCLVMIVNVFYIMARMRMPVDGIGSKGEKGHCLVTAVRKASPAAAAGIRETDIIKKINEMDVPGDNHFYLLESFSAGDRVVYTIQRGSEILDFPVTFASFWSQHPWFYFFLYFIILLVSVTSLYILYKKPGDQSVRLFFIFLQLFAMAQNSRFLFIDEMYATVANVAFVMSFNLFGPVLLHFHLIFPYPLKKFRISPYLPWLVYGISIVIGLTLAAVLCMRNIIHDTFFQMVFTKFSAWSVAWMGLTLGAALLIAFLKHIAIRGNPVHKQTRLVLIGSLFGLLTPILFSVHPWFIWRLEREQHLLTILEFSNAAGSYIMITLVGFAIFRYKIWEIETFIRKALLYSAATFIILVIYLSLFFIISLFSLELGTITHFAILFFSMIVFLLSRDIIQKAIDRLFHRESYDSAMVVSRFEESLAGIYQYEKLSSGICRELDEILHFHFIIFALRKQDLQYDIIHRLGKMNEGVSDTIQVSPEMQALLEKGRVFSVEEMQNRQEMPGEGKAEIIVPLIKQYTPMGFLVLSGKRSEQTYTLQDIRILTLLSRRIVAMFHTAGLYMKDLERQIMLERERTRIAEDMHDEVGASLTRISMLSEMAGSGAADKIQLDQWLCQISDTSRKVMEEMNQIIWALNPKNDSLAGLIAYLRRFAMEYFENSSIHCTFDLPGTLPDIDLGVELRRNLYLVVKEALHNVARHSGADEVTVSLKMEGKGFRMYIHDNGTGFDPENLAKAGNGLVNMKKRMQNIGGHFFISSIPGRMTEINLWVPEGR